MSELRITCNRCGKQTVVSFLEVAKAHERTQAFANDDVHCSLCNVGILSAVVENYQKIVTN